MRNRGPFIVAAASCLLLLARPAAAQATFGGTRDLVVVASGVGAFQCPGLDRALFAMLSHAEAVGAGERRCAVLLAALHCVTVPGRTGLPLRTGSDPGIIDLAFARFRQDAASLALGAAIAAALADLIAQGGC